ncbi:B9 domain-containing protein 2 [Catenaria anguillulae PL171]|uniref:B9 domain-containing protein 2 n=1 Tax=Catenaria anguillulae PL171 TaxID=765915 RepID=A0A1Y2HJ20_9FUNG|nr:B9 domain-containing protein 2 [Catenaria anguillulae PL171]
MAELHVLGTLHGARSSDGSAFVGASGLACRWTIMTGNAWTVVEGASSAQTQVDIPADGEWAVWSHPIGWPKLAIEVLRQDMFGRYQLFGYGVMSIPMTAGTHRLECPIWRPHRSWMDSLKATFLGTAVGLKSLDLLVSSADRYQLTTVPIPCTVFAEVTVVHRGFAQNGLHLQGRNNRPPS